MTNSRHSLLTEFIEMLTFFDTHTTRIEHDGTSLRNMLLSQIYHKNERNHHTCSAFVILHSNFGVGLVALARNARPVS